MPSRRSHPKSRHGCIQCKSLHVKCDEVRPVCGLCTRTRRYCEYALALAQSPSSPGVSNVSSNNWSNATFRAERVTLPSLAQVNLPRLQNVPHNADTRSFIIQSDPYLAYTNPLHMPASFENVTTSAMKSADVDPTLHFTFEDLELMHNYTSRTCHTFADFESMEYIWRDTMVYEANNYSFLMHSLLALSALHLASTSIETSPSHPGMSYDQRRNHYSRLAQVHFGHCIAQYRSVLTQITKANSNALFAASSAIALFALAFPHSPCRYPLRSAQPPIPIEPHTRIEEPVAQMSDIFTLLRGISAVVSTAYDWMIQGDFAPLFRGGYLGMPETELPTDVIEAFDRLEDTNRTRYEAGADREAYEDAIEKLKICFRRVLVNLGDRGQVLSWAISLNTPYLDRLKKLEPMALALVAYYAILLNTIDENWWAKGWGLQVLRNVQELLKGSSGRITEDRMISDLIEWPLSKFEQGEGSS